MRTALYPGTFDPVTLGHVDLVERGLRLFDRVLVAVADSTSKGPMFSPEERVSLFSRATSHLQGVDVVLFRSLTVDFARERGACAIIRGLRAVSDFDYEFQLAWMNRRLDAEIETVFLCPNENYSYVNSSLVKEISKLGGDISDFVPTDVERALRERFRD
ncbi:MAG TPA: pantetheine-phosphate adenylyltransferase [bacterium]|nr:pantetheine-phosphate adenylyltransferase [bacterium]